MKANGYLDDVEAQLAELTERGAHTRLRARLPFGELRSAPGGTGGPAGGGPRRRRELLTIVPAVLVTVAVVLIVLTLGNASHHSNTATGRTGHGHRSSQPRHVTKRLGASTHTTAAASSTTAGPPQPSGPVPAGFSAPVVHGRRRHDLVAAGQGAVLEPTVHLDSPHRRRRADVRRHAGARDRPGQ